MCRLFLPFSRPISARISIFSFYAEKITLFHIRILHEFDFSNFMQKKSCLSPPNFCKNPTFPFFCRKNHELPPSFSARFSLFHFRAENVAQSTQNCLHKSQISHFVQKPARNCGAVGGGAGTGAGTGLAMAARRARARGWRWRRDGCGHGGRRCGVAGEQAGSGAGFAPNPAYKTLNCKKVRSLEPLSPRTLRTKP
ncbi:MAG: hypothetical protein MJ129_04815 [Clostridia bacterium]|nr:hypothetical protein [Clostridia bacterium]